MSTIVTDLLEPTQVAPADQLFFRGQLLPLQLDPRLQLVQTLSKQEGDGSSFCTMQQDVMSLRSCRLEQVSTDAGMIDSRSSSFRSQHSNYWESGEKDSRDSSSSSRCSNGSSQDSCFPPEKKPQANAESSSKMCNSQVSNKSPQPMPKRWSWKSIFNGLKKVSKVWVDDKADEAQHQNSSNPEIRSQKRSVFPLLGVRPPSKSLRSTSTRGASQGYNAHLNRKVNVNYFTLEESEPRKDMKWMSAWNRTPEFSSVSARDSCACTDRLKHKPSWHARERWQKCMNKVKPLYWKISYQKQQHEAKPRSSTHVMKMAPCDRRTASSCRSSSCTPLTKSPVRRDSEYIYNSSAKYLAVASCPASMRSSPHHSGVLAVVNKGSAISGMHDLHSAIQGAIAHCKQSQSGRISSPPTRAEDGNLED